MQVPVDAGLIATYWLVKCFGVMETAVQLTSRVQFVSLWAECCEFSMFSVSILDVRGTVIYYRIPYFYFSFHEIF